MNDDAVEGSLLPLLCGTSKTSAPIGALKYNCLPYYIMTDQPTNRRIWGVIKKLHLKKREAQLWVKFDL